MLRFFASFRFSTRGGKGVGGGTLSLRLFPPPPSALFPQPPGPLRYARVPSPIPYPPIPPLTAYKRRLFHPVAKLRIPSSLFHIICWYVGILVRSVVPTGPQGPFRLIHVRTLGATHGRIRGPGLGLSSLPAPSFSRIVYFLCSSFLFPRTAPVFFTFASFGHAHRQVGARSPARACPRRNRGIWAVGCVLRGSRKRSVFGGLGERGGKGGGGVGGFRGAVIS